jgi:hypothetical protein
LRQSRLSTPVGGGYSLYDVPENVDQVVDILVTFYNKHAAA